MPFRDVILFYLSHFLLMDDVYSMKMAISLCRGFNIELSEIVNEFKNKKFLSNLLKVFECKDLMSEIIVGFPDNIIQTLIKLRLCNFSKTIKASYKLNNNMNGIAILKNRDIFVIKANDTFINFLFTEYNNQIYSYVKKKPKSLIGCKLIICGYSNVTFLAYTMTNITSNTKLNVVVTKRCIQELTKLQNLQLLKNLFDKGSGTINKVLKKVFYSVLGGGQTQ
ncbi:transcriptional elongation factor [Tanapox virus]|uniref:Late transcription elongation factor OPG087 n=2 Tax=Tanapox virus TaxID=99000 RepID=A7XCH2_9POXV|nr:52R protein [Yaba-like disease virus]ABQ43527.1 transcriptional elongation factor [Tanapox virus]ABQ43682.1 transcriptional elongation factor [Tanapox virus]CAC21290.1 52R protein [Yaba-like disease virus]